MILRSTALLLLLLLFFEDLLAKRVEKVLVADVLLQWLLLLAMRHDVRDFDVSI